MSHDSGDPAFYFAIRVQREARVIVLTVSPLTKRFAIPRSLSPV